MFKICVARDVIEHARRQVASHNFGQRCHGNGTPEQQLTGVIAENAVLRLLGLPLNDGGNGCDDGVDCRFAGVALDIKTMGRTTDVRAEFVNNFLAAQLSFAVDARLFCSLHEIACGDLSDVSSPWSLREQLVAFGLSEKKCV